VADSLLTIRKRTGHDQFSFSREDLASMVGTATESVIRTLSDFKDEKLIDIREKQIFILNSDGLVKMKN
jgi:CRP-like cAMP-binding protein